MKILHISTGFPVTFSGGITNYVRALVRSQIAMGNKVHVLAPHETDAEWAPIVKPFSPNRVVRFGLYTPELDKNDASTWNQIVDEKYDLVHFHMSLDMSRGMFLRFAESSVPYVVSLHDYYYLCPRITMVDFEDGVCRFVDVSKCRSCIGLLDQIEILRKGARKAGLVLPRVRSSTAEVRLKAMKTFLVNAKVLLPVSVRTAEIYRSVVPQARFIVEHIGNESATHQPIEHVPSESIRAVFIGTLNRSKGAVVLEKIMKRVLRKDIEFHFYGRAFEGFDKRLSRLGLKLHGSYSPNDVPNIMASADVGLVLSIWEDNGPQVVMEFVNYGVPVIGTKRGGIPDFVGPENGIIFDPEDKLEFETTVQWLENVTQGDLRAMSAGMKPLITPAQHAERIQMAYEIALGLPPCEREHDD